MARRGDGLDFVIESVFTPYEEPEARMPKSNTRRFVTLIGMGQTPDSPEFAHAGGATAILPA